MVPLVLLSQFQKPLQFAVSVPFLPFKSVESVIKLLTLRFLRRSASPAAPPGLPIRNTQNQSTSS